MATHAAYLKNLYESTDKRRGGHAPGKRKRDSLEGLGVLGRAAPNTRRASAQNAAQQQVNDVLANPSAAIADMSSGVFPSSTNGNGADDGAQHFDFSLQQPIESSLVQGASGQDVGSANVDTAAAALSQHYNMQVPHGDDFGGQTGNEADDSNLGLEDSNAFQGLDGGDVDVLGADGSSSRKPPVGSEEWHKVRKDNHKEVERRRRETINEGINELAKIVPNCEKNKGAVLQRAVQYIAKLQDEATSNIDKWTFEKLITEQAINDLSSKLARAWAEKEAWKRLAREAGVDVDAADLGLGAAGGAASLGAPDAVAAAVTGEAVQAAAQAVDVPLSAAQMQNASSVDIEHQVDAK